MQAVERLKPIAAQLAVGLARSAFFAALAGHSGLPASELEGALRSKVQTLKPAPKPASPAPPRAAERAPEPLEAHFGALCLKDRKLLSKDRFRICDELRHAGLRSLISQVAGGQAAEDVLHEASPLLKAALEAAVRQLPADPQARETTFVSACRRLKLKRIDEQLSHIARVTSQVEGANELTDETRKLLTERSDLLALKRKVLEESA